jgi:hypothetical protein
MLEFRNSDRIIIDSHQVVDILWKRIQPFMPPNWYPDHKQLGINERLRFLRYDKGQYFKPHTDGSYYEEGSDPPRYTLVTLQLYLNEGFKGGSTTFMGRDENVECVPKIGKALIFEHDISHEGSLLEEGRKYAVRSDFMYEEIPSKNKG